MMILAAPDALQKLNLMAENARYEAAGETPHSEKPGEITPERQGQRNIPLGIRGVLSCITEVSTPGGKKPILKAMITTACEMNCYYCPFRAGRGVMRRVTFKPDELAAAFDQIQRAGLVDGIFLSSGILKGGVATQDKIIETAEIIRRRYGYRGYVHLKIMPGAQFEQVRRAMQLADRVSVNLEGATAQRLEALAPRKNFEENLLGRLGWTQTIRAAQDPRDPDRIRASAVTQFVVGAVGDTDLELLSISERLYQQMALKRAYYSAFNPVRDTPFENKSATPAVRQLRLYQASFLLRDYEWDIEDLPFEGEGDLRLDVDPKQAYADVTLKEAPVEIMQAERRDLLRVPGIGPKGAELIMQGRCKGVIKDIQDLRGLGLRGVERAAPYILLDGHRPDYQMGLL
jgi:predicted DNA-binding helix-hairpin-helix protein